MGGVWKPSTSHLKSNKGGQKKPRRVRGENVFAASGETRSRQEIQSERTEMKKKRRARETIQGKGEGKNAFSQEGPTIDQSTATRRMKNRGGGIARLRKDLRRRKEGALLGHLLGGEAFRAKQCCRLGESKMGEALAVSLGLNERKN